MAEAILKAAGGRDVEKFLLSLVAEKLDPPSGLKCILSFTRNT